MFIKDFDLLHKKQVWILIQNKLIRTRDTACKGGKYAHIKAVYKYRTASNTVNSSVVEPVQSGPAPDKNVFVTQA